MQKVRVYISFAGNTITLEMSEDLAKELISKYQTSMNVPGVLLYGKNFTFRLDSVCGIAYAKIQPDSSEAWKYASEDDESENTDDN
jgi:hypothetical protein